MEVFLKDGRHMDVTRIVCTDEKGKPVVIGIDQVQELWSDEESIKLLKIDLTKEEKNGTKN
jgi:hypothetical protein